MSEYICENCDYESNEESDFIRAVHKKQDKMLCNDCSELEEEKQDD